METNDRVRLVPIGGGWSLWSDVWLRSAGFPARLAKEVAFERSRPFEEERRRVSERLRTLAVEPRFREALTWQNRRALHGSIRALTKRPIEAQDSKTREYERLVTSYLYRYCGKNETVGFFGPVAWARLRDDLAEGVVLSPGRSLLAVRNVYLEHWCVDAVAQALTKDRALRLSIAPRIHPALRIEGGMLHRVAGERIPLPEHYARALERCDGRTSASQIAKDAADDDLSQEELVEILEELAEKKMVLWTLDAPVDVRHPDQYLRGQLERLPATPATLRALRTVDELIAARRAIVESSGTPALDEAIARLEELFRARTEVEPLRRPGETYAGRTLVVEECVRDVACEIGRPFLRKLRPLELILTSARWYTYEIARRFAVLFRSALDRPTDGALPQPTDFRLFWNRIEPQLNTLQTELVPIVRDVKAMLQERWVSLLELERGDGSRIVRSFERLAPAVASAFPAPHPGWPGARFHSPDVLIAAESKEAFARGDFCLVLGELHAGACSIVSKVGVFQHPDPEQIYQRAARDLAGPSLNLVEPKNLVIHTDYLAIRPDDFWLTTGDGVSSAPLEKTIALSELEVCDEGDDMVVRTRDRRFAIDLFAMMQSKLTYASLVHFWILPEADHSPRVTIDELIVARESWRFAPEQLPFLAQGDLAHRFALAREWQRRHSLPRFLFVRIKTETKPFMLDLESPISVDIMARRSREAGTVKVSEMVPDFDQLWLTDAEGERYTSELRMVAVDPRPWLNASMPPG